MHTLLIVAALALVPSQDPSAASDPAPPPVVEAPTAPAPATASPPAAEESSPWLAGLVGGGSSCLGSALGMVVGSVPMFMLGAAVPGTTAIIGLPVLFGCSLCGAGVGALVPTLFLPRRNLAFSVAAVTVPTAIAALAGTMAGIVTFAVGYSVGEATGETAAGVGTAAVIALVAVPVAAVITGLSYLGVVLVAGAFSE